MNILGTNIRTAVFAASLFAGPVVTTAAVVPAIDAADIARYVYPDNAPATPGRMAFMPDGESFLRLSADGTKIVQYATTDGKEMATVFDTTHTREASVKSVEDFTISADGTKLIVWTDSQPVYRRSFTAVYYVFEIKRNILRPLSKSHARQQSPLMSPDGRMVAFVADNNIYLRKFDYDTEVQVTTDGQRNAIINGVPDWVYEEEFATSCSMAWSPDNGTLCYLRYDETAVPVFTFSLYQGWCNPSDQYALYPGSFSYKYPVAGEPNSVVTLHSYDVDTRKIKEIPFRDSSIEYIPRIHFGDTPERLMVVTINRAQNRMELYAANPKSTVVKSVLVEESKAWLDSSTYEDIAFEPTGFMLMSERTGWRHLYRYSYEGQQLRQVTQGSYDVTAYYGTDVQGNVYYQSEPAGSVDADPQLALSRVVYKVDRQGKKTDALTETRGWASATFTPAMNYAVVNYSSAKSAPRYTLLNAKGKTVRTLEDNAKYASSYASLPEKEFFTFNAGGTMLNGYMIKPVGFNAGKRYPVIMWQYSGPGSQEVTDRWHMDWDYYATTKGFVVVCVDGRGTGGRGRDFRSIVYKQLGRYETVDQLAAARYVASLPFVDPARIGIAGWSYGGYETLMCATDAESTYAAAVAIAPVTSWRYYDTVYAERFMLTPGENADGYDEGAPVNRAASLSCPLLIMHGTADDNVHLSNSIEFVGRLQQAHRYADMLLFPGMNHSINGCDARAMVYGRMVDFFSRNL